jgi:hypothetical protein
MQIHSTGMKVRFLSCYRHMPTPCVSLVEHSVCIQIIAPRFRLVRARPDLLSGMPFHFKFAMMAQALTRSSTYIQIYGKPGLLTTGRWTRTKEVETSACRFSDSPFPHLCTQASMGYSRLLNTWCSSGINALVHVLCTRSPSLSLFS